MLHGETVVWEFLYVGHSRKRVAAAPRDPAGRRVPPPVRADPRSGIAPGQSITVASLAEAFDVSPMPVREALVRLQAIGALTVVSGRTIGIPKLARARLDDLTRVRLETEATAIRWASARADATFLADLVPILDRLREAERTADAKLYVAPTTTCTSASTGRPPRRCWSA